MKKFKLLVAILAFSSFGAQAEENYKIDPFHTSVVWSASHFGFSSPSGMFSEIEGDLILDEKNPAKSKVKITIKTNNLNTGYVKFDNHLKGEDFFDVKKYPTATFVSKKVVLNGKNKAKITGDFTLMGITKSVELNARLNKIDINPFTQRKTAGFSANATIKRSDFGIDYALPGVGDLVKLTIELEAVLEDKKIADPKK